MFRGYWSSNLVNIDFTGVSRTHTENEVLFTLSDSFVPAIDMTFPGMIGTTPCLVKVYRDTGNCQLYLASSYGTGRIRFNLMYLYKSK